MILLNKYKYLIFAVLISFFSVVSLLNPGLPPTHDGEYHVLRFYQFNKAFMDGNLYPRWAPDFNNGYGIPLFNFVYPLPNYVASFFHFLGFEFIESFKLNMISATLIGAVGMYLFARKYFGELGGVVSAVFYSFSPYHLLDIYVRGSVGEVWALGLAPALLWAYSSFFETRKKIFLVLSSIFLALLVFAHNILALIFFGFFVSYAIFLILRSRNIKSDLVNLGIIIFTGLGLSSIFWLPALLETKYVVGLQVFDPTAHFPAIYKLIYSSWGYGFSGTGVADQMSFQIGIVNLFAFLGSVIVFYITKKRILLFFISMFIFSVFLITPASFWLWKNIPLISFVQFPWRFLSLSIFTVSFLAGSLVMHSLFKKRKNIQVFMAILLILASILFSINYAKAPFHHKREDQHYFTRSNFTDGTNSPGNSFNTRGFDNRLKKADNLVNLDQSEYKIISNESEKKVMETYIDDDKKIIANIAYFQGWTATVNDIKIPITPTGHGLIEFDLPKNKSRVEISFRDTVVRKVSKVIFASSLIFLGLFMVFKSNTIKK